MNATIARILATSYPSYQKPVRRVWTWNRDGNAESLKLAEELARGLKEKYPHVLQVRYELAFSLVRQKRRSEALRELRETAGEFPVLDEDCLSLSGRCHKDEGDELLAKDFLAGAEREYRDAEQCYEKAYQLRLDRFPGINTAALRLIRAGLWRTLSKKEPSQDDSLNKQADNLLRLSAERANELLARQDTWDKRLPDDDIWILATAAEALLILQRWDDAAQHYREALSKPNIQSYHPESMKAQVDRVLAAFDRLEIAREGPFVNSAEFFANASASNKA